MQQVFIDLIVEEKQGKTILMSSHIFTELSVHVTACLIIKDVYVTVENIRDLYYETTSDRCNRIIRGRD